MKRGLLFILSVFLICSLFAFGENFPDKAKNVNGFVPTGWKKILSAKGDLNNDKLETITLSGNETISSSWEVSYDADKQIYRVFGGKIEKFARRTNFDQFESVNRLRDIMRRYGIAHELMRQGATGDSLVQIGESTPFTLVEQ